jgi:pyruvate, water dikinase
VIVAGAVVPLVEARDESRFGGKAVQLGAACRAGLPVPPGVALSARLVEALVAGDPAAAAAFQSAVGGLHGPLAVRSSAVGEDAAGASFAGQHATKLNVRGAAALAAAVAAVCRSGRSEGALAYRRTLGLEEAPRIGVVVQQLVEPDIAGVLFTRNPVTGTDERLIEAAWGLGEAVVQGLVIPDRYRVSRAGEVLERTAGHKPIAIRARVDGAAATEPVAPDLVEALCLDDAELRALHGIAHRCEESFEGPSDIEWALAGGSLHLLQRRRITRVAA